MGLLLFNHLGERCSISIPVDLGLFIKINLIGVTWPDKLNFLITGRLRPHKLNFGISGLLRLFVDNFRAGGRHLKLFRVD